MSYVLSGSVIDIEKLESVVGSKDPAVLEAIVADGPEVFEDGEDELEEDELSLATALRQLIMGEEKDPDEAHQYGYAFIQICNYLADEPLECDYWGGVRWAAIEECGLVDLLEKTGAPVDLPPIDDFPVLAHIRRNEIDTYLQAAKSGGTCGTSPFSVWARCSQGTPRKRNSPTTTRPTPCAAARGANGRDG